MAVISLTSLMTLPSPVVIISTTLVKASAWVGKDVLTDQVPSISLWVMTLDSMPIRSHRPLHSSFSPSMSISWYFSEEEPQLITRTFM